MKTVQIEGLGSIPYPAVKFFGMFARIEFALLAAGYIGGEVGENAWADWDKFAMTLNKTFFSAVEADPSAKILFKEPPRKLIRISDKECKFVDNLPAKNATDLLLLVRTIRNNLFHGSKVYFTERDEQLVVAGTFVLSCALDVAALTSETNRVSSAYAYAELGWQ